MSSRNTCKSQSFDSHNQSPIYSIVSYDLLNIIIIDDASELEDHQMLTTNAEENQSSATLDALHHTQSASVRVTEETGKELDQSDIAETDPITEKPSQLRHKVSVSYP